MKTTHTWFSWIVPTRPLLPQSPKLPEDMTFTKVKRIIKLCFSLPGGSQLQYKWKNISAVCVGGGLRPLSHSVCAGDSDRHFHKHIKTSNCDFPVALANKQDGWFLGRRPRQSWAVLAMIKNKDVCMLVFDRSRESAPFLVKYSSVG